LSTQRLYFIDAVRAFAILMMLQGHFIDALLAVEYRDMSHVAYRIWSYFRGVTAPTFFTISGLIFTYLLLKAKDKGNEKERMRKGIIRGFMLISLGYLLRIPFFQWLIGEFNSYFLVVDVLQIIGLSLIGIVTLYYLSFKNSKVFALITFALGFLIFVTEPWYRTLTLEHVPIIFSNYVSKANGSVFTIIPWFGYIAFGACLATAFSRYLKTPKFKPVTLTGFFVLGYLLIEWSSHGLFYLFKGTGIRLFYEASQYNYLFSRLGDVFIYYGIFYGLESYLRLPLLLKIGQKTLSIYVIHFIIIYGSFTGFGLSQLIGKNLTPWQVVIGAFIFLIVVCFISFYYVKTNTYLYSRLRAYFYRVKGRLKT
jgi:uncharacterized membrane protein